MIAEFMLQRTRAEQVAPVYKAFIRRYPTTFSLSKAKAKDVGRFTEHLGMHWRARHFIDAAKFIQTTYAGRIPSDRKKLLAIPGVGEYVAAAILTVAFNKREWVVDSNIARFINRFYGLRLKGEIRRNRMVIEKAREIFDYENTRHLLFALLDFTALICKPIKPECHACPLKKKCAYERRRAGPADGG